MEKTVQTGLLVLGGGPGGYTAAFRAADLGLDVVLVERDPYLGGVCLNVGCIPSKTLLHAALVLKQAREISDHGISFSEPVIELTKLRNWKDSVVDKLTQGLAGLAGQRNVKVLQGEGQFAGSHELRLTGPEGDQRILFEQAIIAAGSHPVRLSMLPSDPRIMDSTSALNLEDIPKRLLVLGGGIIGLEMAEIYSSLGSQVTIVERTDDLLPGCDRDLVKPLKSEVSKHYEAVLTKTEVTAVVAEAQGLRVSFNNSQDPAYYDKLLCAVGRAPNGNALNAEKAGFLVDNEGFIRVDEFQRTTVKHIYAIGDVVGNPMLAHKATYEGKVAAEVAAGYEVANDAKVIPSVAYTHPEVAWVGLTETQARVTGRQYIKASFPWLASGRARTFGAEQGLSKLLVDPDTGVIIGAGIVGANAGELIVEAALAIELGLEPSEIALTIHPHPTLSETVAFAAEAYDGTLTELYLDKFSI